MTLPADDTLTRETTKLWVTDAELIRRLGENSLLKERGGFEIVEVSASPDGNKFFPPKNGSGKLEQ